MNAQEPPVSRRPAWVTAIEQAGWPSQLAAMLLLGFWIRYFWGVEGYENDFFWHLKTGLLNLQTRSLNELDLFSWTAYQKPWLNQEWLGQVVLAWLFEAGKFQMIKWFWALLLILQFGLIAHVFLKARCSLFLSTLGTLVICLLLGNINLLTRMQTFSLLGLSLTAIVLQRWWQERPLGAWRYLYPAVIILWANLHGGAAIAGPMSLTLVLLTESAVRFKERHWQELRPLLLLTLASWAALIVNPHHVQLLAYSLSSLIDPSAREMHKIIREWQPFSFALSDSWRYLLWFAGILAALIPFRSKPELAARLPMLVFWLAWTLMAMRSIRFLPFAMIASAPLMASLLSELFQRWADWKRVRIGAYGGITAVVALLLLIPRALQLNTPAMFAGNTFPSMHAVSVLKSRAIQSRLFNLYDWGGFIIFTSYPDVKVFIDGRQYLYGVKLNQVHQTIKHARPGWQEAIAELRLEAVFVPPNIRIASELRSHPGWQVAYEDPTAVLFLKNRTPVR